jgi:regulator of nucleoside diphosphate kinase
MDRNTTVWVTPHDMNRLRQLADDLVRTARAAQSSVETVEEILDAARVAAAGDIPATVATMHSIVTFEDVRSGETRTITIVYPDEADPALARVSVLSPVGAALLGMREGEETELPLPHARSPRIRVLAVLREPVARDLCAT